MNTNSGIQDNAATHSRWENLGTQTWAYLQLLRPANIVTAWADILMGFAASGAIALLTHANQLTTATSLLALLLATTGLYGGGVVFNDVCDVNLDRQERPERPLPSGRASLSGAILLGSGLLLMGVVAAAYVSQISALLAASIAVAALLYDAWSKHHPLLGPLNMGLCRGLNGLLGVSAVSGMVQDQWFLALIPIGYIAAVTTISQGEVHGGQRWTGAIALLLLGITFGGVLTLGYATHYQVLIALPFWVLLVGRVVPPFVRATQTPEPDVIRIAVKTGVLSLILLNATLTAGFAGVVPGLVTLSLLPLSLLLAKRFAVT